MAQAGDLPVKQHRYAVEMEWTGNTGSGTATYRSYSRSYETRAEGRAPIAGSSDPHFRGDPARWNPEQLLVSALSSCHMLSYLHLCATAGIAVQQYRDNAEGFMAETRDGSGSFTRVVLRPAVRCSPGADLAQARELHHAAHAKCFIANSVNFPVECEPTIEAA